MDTTNFNAWGNLAMDYHPNNGDKKYAYPPHATKTKLKCRFYLPTLQLCRMYMFMFMQMLYVFLMGSSILSRSGGVVATWFVRFPRDRVVWV